MSLESRAPQLQRMAIAVLIAVLLAAFIPTNVTHAQESTPVSYTFEECDQVKASTLRDELNRITQAIFEKKQGGIDLTDIVDRNWNALNLDETVNAAVEKATQRVKEETGFWDRFISGWNPEKAKELTEDVATYAFDSSDFRQAFDQLSLNVSDEIVTEIRMMTEKSASSALLCVQTFIGDKISPTLAAALEEQIQSRLFELQDPESEIGWVEIASANSMLLSGLGTIVAAQIAKRLGKVLAGKIAGQIIKRVLTRVITIGIPLVGTLIGAALTVWDLWNASKGSLPMIQEALQDPEVKEEIMAQVSLEVGEELRVGLPQLARSISNDVYGQWQEFRRKYARVLELAENHARFRNILDNTVVEEVQKLADFATLVEDRFGFERLRELIDKGHFERLLGLPEETLDMLAVVDDPQVAIDWADLAGESLMEVIEKELYRVSSPSDFRDRADLERVLAVGDAELIQKLMSLNADARHSVLGLPTAHIAQILDALSVDELTWVAEDYLPVLDERLRNILVDRILRQPEIKSDLSTGVVRGALLASKDIEGSLNYVGQRSERGNWIGNTFDMLAAIGPTVSGELPFSLFWHFDGRILVNVLYVLAGLIALYLVWRRVFPGRRQDVNVNVIVPNNQGTDESASGIRRIETRSDEEDD